MSTVRWTRSSTARSLPGESGYGARLAVTSGSAVITPPVGTPMAGYGVDAPRLAKAVRAPLKARCTILWMDGRPWVLLTADVLGYTHRFHEAVRGQVVDLGVATADFVFTATHTHNGPLIADDPTNYTLYTVADGSAEASAAAAYRTWLQDVLVALVAETLQRPRTACTLDYQVAAESFSINREGVGQAETAVPILVARRLDGRPVAVLFGYGCHPVAGGIRTSIDPDYPGVAAGLVEETLGVTAQFITGAAGDQDPPEDDRGWELSMELGRRLGNVVLGCLSEPGRPVSGPFVTALRDVELPLAVVEVGSLAASLADRLTQPDLPGWKRRHAEMLLDRLAAGEPLENAVRLPLQVLSFPATSEAPPLHLVFTGGELVSGYADLLRSHYGGDEGIWISAYANAVPAYLPTDELLARGGIHYACGWDDDHPLLPGGAACAYGLPGPFRRSDEPGGVEPTLVTAIDALIRH